MTSAPLPMKKRAARDTLLDAERQARAGLLSEADKNVFLKSTASEIVSNIQNKIWTASQVLEAFIAQALIAHTATNCITEVLFEDARQLAKDLDLEFESTGQLKGPLHGVPISVKDQYDIRGYDTTNGLTSCIDKPATTNSDFVQTMIDAGAVPFVKTNVPQTLYMYECSNPIYGRSTNPYNAAYSCGGSSGGEACMLAFDASVIGLGSDIAGSLRIPASYCGIYSLKPGIGRVSDQGAMASFPGFEGIKSVCGPMARCMDDLELACRVSFGAPGQYNEHVPLPFREQALPQKLKFGYYTDGIIKGSPAVIRAVQETVAALRAAGHECVEIDMHLGADVLNNWMQLTSADRFSSLLRGVGSDPLEPFLSMMTLPPKLPHLVRNTAAWGAESFMGDKILADVLRNSTASSADGYHQAVIARDILKKRFTDEIWNKYALDGIITHVHATPQIPHGGSTMLSAMSTSTALYNFVDCPVGVVPVTLVDVDKDELTDEWRNGPGHGSLVNENELYTKGNPRPVYDPAAMHGMPVGVQVVGRRWEDEKVLGMMRLVDAVLGPARGFLPGSWEKRIPAPKAA